MTQTPGQQTTPEPAKDDLEAVRLIATVLAGFSEKDRERILRWVRERLGMAMAVAQQSSPVPPPGVPPASDTPVLAEPERHTPVSQDIKTFVASKNPHGDNKFAATVAYYHQFIAPPAERRDHITAHDVTDACRKADRHRIARSAQVLVNAFHAGYFDRAERGAYKLNSVGENLVAMVLPEGGPEQKAPAKRPSGRKPRPAAKANRRGSASKR